VHWFLHKTFLACRLSDQNSSVETILRLAVISVHVYGHEYSCACIFGSRQALFDSKSFAIRIQLVSSLSSGLGKPQYQGGCFPAKLTSWTCFSRKAWDDSMHQGVCEDLPDATDTGWTSNPYFLWTSRSLMETPVMESYFNARPGQMLLLANFPLESGSHSSLEKTQRLPVTQMLRPRLFSDL
jgi:hypothetical protein